MEGWEELAGFTLQNCQETPFNGDTLLCSNGSNGRREMKRRSNIAGGVLEEVTALPCLDCTDLLTWTDWEPCTGTEKMFCRQRGNDLAGFEKERTEGRNQQCNVTMTIKIMLIYEAGNAIMALVLFL